LIDPLMVMRAIHFAATLMVAGGLLFACCVAEPAFRTVADAPARAVQSFRARLSALLSVSLGFAVVSGAGWWLLLAGRIGDQPLSEAIADEGAPHGQPGPLLGAARQSRLTKGRAPPIYPANHRKTCHRRSADGRSEHRESPQLIEIAAKSPPQQPAGAAPGPRLCDQ